MRGEGKCFRLELRDFFHTRGFGKVFDVRAQFGGNGGVHLGLLVIGKEGFGTLPGARKRIKTT